MSRLIDQGLMTQVWAVLNSRKALPRAQTDGRPNLKLVSGLQARDEDGGGTYAELYIYDEISWFGISAQDVAAALADVQGDLNVRINSPGGDVFDGVAIYNMLADHDGRVTVTVDGLAASAASFIAMAGDSIVMKRASQMMIHDAIGVCIGNAADMVETAGLLERVSDIIASIYTDRAGGTPKSWRKQMQAETWYAAQEAVDAGLATAVASKPPPKTGAESVAAAFDLSIFRYPGRDNAPAPDVAAKAVVDVAMAVHHTGTEDSSWDGPGAVAAMPADAAVLKATHAWRDPDGDPDAKGSYKFPHHHKSGGPANMAACRNGLARLSSAHIPDGDRTGVEAHLRAHLKDGDGDIEDDDTSDMSTWEIVDETGIPDSLTVEDLAAYDPDVFKAALATAADGFTFEPDTFRSAVAKAAGFDFDGDVFKAALELHSGNAPAAPQREEPAPAQDSYDATTVTRAIREAIR